VDPIAKGGDDPQQKATKHIACKQKRLGEARPEWCSLEGKRLKKERPERGFGSKEDWRIIIK